MPVWAILLIIGGIVFFVLPVGCVMLVAVASNGKPRPTRPADDATEKTPVQSEQNRTQDKYPPVGKLDRTDFNKLSAWVYAQELIAPRLKAPSTAKYPEAREIEGWHEGQGKYRFVGWVDSQNGFGAMTRTNFEVVVQETEDGWGLVNFKQLP